MNGQVLKKKKKEFLDYSKYLKLEINWDHLTEDREEKVSDTEDQWRDITHSKKSGGVGKTEIKIASRTRGNILSNLTYYIKLE